MDHLGEDGYQPSPVLEKALDVLFLLHADHELNASCTTVLQTGSSLVDPYSAIAYVAMSFTLRMKLIYSQLALDARHYSKLIDVLQCQKHLPVCFFAIVGLCMVSAMWIKALVFSLTFEYTGGANEAVIRMLISIGSPDNVPAFVEAVKRREKVLSGFGHR